MRSATFFGFAAVAFTALWVVALFIGKKGDTHFYFFMLSICFANWCILRKLEVLTITIHYEYDKKMKAEKRNAKTDTINVRPLLDELND